MVKEYLKNLKSKGNFSWSELSSLSGIPDATIRKIFSGETADPRMETVVKLITAMGGSLDELAYGEKKKETEINAIMAMKEVYETRIAEIKESSAERTQSLQKDKKFLAVVCCILGITLILFVLIDLLIGTVGWIRY